MQHSETTIQPQKIYYYWGQTESCKIANVYIALDPDALLNGQAPQNSRQAPEMYSYTNIKAT